ncbi:helix-turn-helix domain-containing protein [Amycolatopsis azurea]|uniref:helix-turn-helix domain-containing protein n=1 Tax=Amycolatopsis azurea TaxID=36819 RepID=UPI003807F641
MGGKAKTTDNREAADSGDARSLAGLVRLLFDRVKRPDGEDYTPQQVAAGMSELTGENISRQYVTQLRNGDNDNPTRRRLQALADFFKVPAAYFFDDARSREIAQQIETATALQSPTTRALALELLRKTDPADVEMVAELVRSLTARPDLRNVVELALTLDSPELQLAGDLLRSVQQRRSPDSEK